MPVVAGQISGLGSSGHYDDNDVSTLTTPPPHQVTVALPKQETGKATTNRRCD